MALIALLFAHHGAGHDGEPPAALRVAGVTVIERQILAARAHGASRVLVVVERMPPALAAALDGADVKVVRSATGLRIAPDDQVLVIADSLLVDPRVISTVLSGRAPTLAVWRGRGARDGAERLDPNSHWAGVALYGGGMVAATLAGLGEWDLQATLLRAAYADGRPTRVDVGTLGGTRLRWMPVRTVEEAAVATQAELAASEAEGRDWLSHLVHRPIELAAVPHLLSRRVATLPIVAAAMSLAFLAVIAFAAGYPWTGLVAAILSAPLFGIGEKIAHVRSEDGRLASAIVPIEWGAEACQVVALALWFSASHELAAPWAVAALILTGAGGTAYARAAYRRLTGRSLDEAGTVERRLRSFGGQRNALCWSLLPFATLGLWWPGYVAIAAYALGTFLLTGWRLIFRLGEAGAGPGTAPQVSRTAAAAPSPQMFETDPD